MFGLLFFQTLVQSHAGGDSGPCLVPTAAARSELLRGVPVQHPWLEAGCGQNAGQARGRRWHCTLLQSAGPQGILLPLQVSWASSHCCHLEFSIEGKCHAQSMAFMFVCQQEIPFISKIIFKEFELLNKYRFFKSWHITCMYTYNYFLKLKS